MKLAQMFKALRWSPLSLYLSVHGLKKSNTPVKEYLAFATHLHTTRGKRNAVSILKDINNRAKAAALGYPVMDRSIAGTWFRINKLGLPKELKVVSSLIQTNPKLGLLIPNLVYLMRLPCDTNTDTITNVYTGSWDIAQTYLFQRFLEKACPRLEPSRVQLVPSIKAGPNGRPAILTAAQDAYAWLSKPLKMFLLALGTSVVRVQNSPPVKVHDNASKEDTPMSTNTSSTSDDELAHLKVPAHEHPNKVFTLLQNFLNNSDPKSVSGSRHLSRLAFLSDKAGKTRVICVMNWWAQQCLLPLHDSMMDWFRTQPSDATWDQAAGVQRIQAWTAEGRTLYSFDLTAFTDRWPVWHQKIVMSVAFGRAWADLWEFLVSKLPVFNPDTNTYISYRVGQGMGSYSSWSAAALTHHMTIRWIASEWKRPLDYAILGDDVVIADDIIAQKYVQVLSSLGVDISRGKSIINKHDGPSSAEFAKNLLYEGQNLTPMSPTILFEVYDLYEWWKFPELLRDSGILEAFPIYKVDGATFLPKIIDQLLKPLKRYREKILILITAPMEPRYWCKAPAGWVPDGDTYVSEADLWSGIGIATYSTYHLEVLLEGLQKAAGSLIELRESLKKESGKKLSGYSLDTPTHPIFECLKALDHEITIFCRLIDTMDSSAVNRSRLLHLMVDADCLKAILVEGKSFSEWKTKDLRTKLGANLRVRVHDMCRNPDKYASCEDYSDW